MPPPQFFVINFVINGGGPSSGGPGCRRKQAEKATMSKPVNSMPQCSLHQNYRDSVPILCIMQSATINIDRSGHKCGVDFYHKGNDYLEWLSMLKERKKEETSHEVFSFHSSHYAY